MSTHRHQGIIKPQRRGWGRVSLVAMASAALLLGACGGGGSGGSSGSQTAGAGDEGTPQSGGTVIYALESETNSGWCLQEAQLAISGIQVARAIYDTLVQPDESGEMQPMLAESVEPNATFDSWTIKIRPGITFHDGSKLDAKVVANNLNAYRGKYKARSPLLFVFVLENIATVEATDDMTVTVTTKTPWPSFPNFLWNDGRLGIVGQAQLDDAKGCDKNLVGTGPFVKKEWKINDHFTATKNPDYWQKDADGTQLPYLDEIEFRPQPEPSQRTEGIQTGTYDAAHVQGGDALIESQSLADAGAVNLIANSDFAEVSYLLFNVAKAPFNNVDARMAVAQALNRKEANQLLSKGQQKVASGPFAPGSMGYLADAGLPAFDLKAAKTHVAAYEKATGKKLSFLVPFFGNAEAQATLELYQSQLAEAGIELKLQPTEQSAEIDRAIAGDFGALLWRNHPGGDPDLQYVWWQSESPVNFGKFADPEIDKLLNEGRENADPAERTKIYEELNRRFGSELYNVWTAWVKWGVVSAPKVHGILGPDVDGKPPFPGLATGHPVSGMWVDG